MEPPHVGCYIFNERLGRASGATLPILDEVMAGYGQDQA